METGQDKSTTGAIHFATRDPQSTPPPSSLPSTTQWGTTTTPSHTWKQHANGRRTGEEWRRFGERRRRELLEKDERDGGTHFRIHKRCKILKYFALAERVMQQFLDVFNHGHGRNSEETYLMGHRLWVFASTALPRHPEYMSSAVAPQRHANVQNMGRIQQCMVQLALQIDEEQLNKYITNDFDPVVLDEEEEEEGDDESTSSSSSVPEIDLREFQEDTSGPSLLATTAMTTTPTTTTTAKDKDNGWERFTGWSFLTTSSCAPWSGHDHDDFAPGAVDTDTASHDWSGSADLSSESETDSEAHEPYFPSLAAVSERSEFMAKKHNVPERDPPPHAEKPDAPSPRQRKSVHFKEPLEEIEEPDEPELVFQYVPLEEAVIVVDDHDVVNEGEDDVDSEGQEYLFDFHESAFLQQVASEDVPYESDSEAFDSWAQEEESDILTISSGTALTCDPARLAFREIMNRVPREDPTWVRKVDAPSNVKTPTSTTPPRQLPASTSAETLNASTTSPSSSSKNPRPDYSPSKRLHNRHHWASFDFATVRRSFEPR